MKLNMDFHSLEENSLLELLQSGKRFLIITGEVNSGKTSTVEKMISLLQTSGRGVGGVYSKGIFNNRGKSGFNMVDIKSGELIQIASINSDEKFMLKQGRFFFNPEVFDKYNKREDELSESDVVIVDEIGYLELK